jgi:hypothetical protein
MAHADIWHQFHLLTCLTVLVDLVLIWIRFTLNPFKTRLRKVQTFFLKTLLISFPKLHCFVSWSISVIFLSIVFLLSSWASVLREFHQNPCTRNVVHAVQRNRRVKLYMLHQWLRKSWLSCCRRKPPRRSQIHRLCLEHFAFLFTLDIHELFFLLQVEVSGLSSAISNKTQPSISGQLVRRRETWHCFHYH